MQQLQVMVDYSGQEMGQHLELSPNRKNKSQHWRKMSIYNQIALMSTVLEAEEASTPQHNGSLYDTTNVLCQCIDVHACAHTSQGHVQNGV